MVGQYRVKRAESPAEVELAALVVAAAVGESYRDIVPEDLLATMTSDEFVTARAESWWQAATDGAHIWIARRTVDDCVVATAYADTSDDPDAPTPLELKTLFALEQAKGSGLADALLLTAIGNSPAFLWTLVGNDRAIGFYRRHGFTLDGVSRVAEHLTTGREGVRPPTEVRLVRLT